MPSLLTSDCRKQDAVPFIGICLALEIRILALALVDDVYGIFGNYRTRYADLLIGLIAHPDADLVCA